MLEEQNSYSMFRRDFSVHMDNSWAEIEQKRADNPEQSDAVQIHCSKLWLLLTRGESQHWIPHVY
jgi:hypothetical protein